MNQMDHYHIQVIDLIHGNLKILAFAFLFYQCVCVYSFVPRPPLDCIIKD